MALVAQDAWAPDILPFLAGWKGEAFAARCEHQIFSWVMNTVSGYRRRILHRLEAWPCKLLKLGRGKPSEPDPKRKTICEQILEFEGQPEKLHLSARKVLLAFGHR